MTAPTPGPCPNCGEAEYIGFRYSDVSKKAKVSWHCARCECDTGWCDNKEAALAMRQRMAGGQWLPIEPAPKEEAP